MSRIRKLFFIVLVLGCLYPGSMSSVPIPKNTTYFTKQKIIPGGFLITELSLLYRSGDQNFRFHQLSYSPLRFWEELRIEGNLLLREGENPKLQAKKCAVFASPKGLRRWYPLRAFDCDHLQMDLEFTQQGAKLLNDPSGETLDFWEISNEKEGEVTGVVVKADAEGIYGFSSRMRYVVQKSKAVLEKNKSIELPLTDGNDSLVHFAYPPFPVQVGDLFKIPKKKATESFLSL